MVDQQRATNPSTAFGRKYPEQVVIATAKDINNIPNPITLGWTMITSHDPAMVAISVGKTRYSHENIRRAGCFTLTFPGEDMAMETLYYGTISGSKAEKLKKFNPPYTAASKIDSIIYTYAVANFECSVVGELDTGDHTLFVGRIEQAWTNIDKKDRIYTLSGSFELGPVKGQSIIKFQMGMFK